MMVDAVDIVTRTGRHERAPDGGTPRKGHSLTDSVVGQVDARTRKAAAVPSARRRLRWSRLRGRQLFSQEAGPRLS